MVYGIRRLLGIGSVRDGRLGKLMAIPAMFLLTMSCAQIPDGPDGVEGGGVNPEPAVARGLVDGSDPEQILSIVAEFGEAELETDGVGDPMIVARAGGLNYLVFFYDCEENQSCKALRFWSYWPDVDVSLEALNDWNNSWRFVKAAIDEDGDVAVHFDVNLAFGVSEANLRDSVDWWTVLTAAFYDEVIVP